MFAELAFWSYYNRDMYLDSIANGAHRHDAILLAGSPPADGYLDMRLRCCIRVVLWPTCELLADQILGQGYRPRLNLPAYLAPHQTCSGA